MNYAQPIFKFILLTVTISCSLLSLADAKADIFGEYVGTLHHERLQKEQLAKLDFFPYRERTNLRFFAVLTLHFGDFQSREYVSYHFDSVRFLLFPPIYTFDQPNQDISVQDGKFSEDGSFEGRVVSKIAGGTVGMLRLQKNGTAKPVLSLIEPIWGEYRGVCGTPEMLTNLQLASFRTNDVSTDEGNPFSAYEIKGKMGYPSGKFTASGERLWTLESHVISGSYNFFVDNLTLIGRNTDLDCRPTPDGLICNGCRLKRVSSETSSPRALAPPRPLSIFSPQIEMEQILSSGSVGQILETGDYEGYLHHEFLDQYQPAKIHIEEFQDPVLGVPLLSVSSSIYFGDFNSAESIVYSFQHYPSSPLPFYVFKNPETDVDGILLLTPTAGGAIRGIWYSLLFGRVGTFELRRGRPRSLLQGVRLIGSVSGKFEGPYGDLNIVVKQTVSPTTTLNPFRQLKIEGKFGPHPSGITPIFRIGNGSYDFYTGRLMIDILEKPNPTGGDYPERFLVGERLSADKMMFKLQIIGSIALSIFSEQTLEPYVRAKP